MALCLALQESQEMLNDFVSVCDEYEHTISANRASGASGSFSNAPASAAYTPRPAVMCCLQGAEIRNSKLRGHQYISLQVELCAGYCISACVGSACVCM